MLVPGVGRKIYPAAVGELIGTKSSSNSQLNPCPVLLISVIAGDLASYSWYKLGVQ